MESSPENASFALRAIRSAFSAQVVSLRPGEKDKPAALFFDSNGKAREGLMVKPDRPAIKVKMKSRRLKIATAYNPVRNWLCIEPPDQTFFYCQTQPFFKHAHIAVAAYPDLSILLGLDKVPMRRVSPNGFQGLLIEVA